MFILFFCSSEWYIYTYYEERTIKIQFYCILSIVHLGPLIGMLSYISVFIYGNINPRKKYTVTSGFTAKESGKKKLFTHGSVDIEHKFMVLIRQL